MIHIITAIIQQTNSVINISVLNHFLYNKRFENVGCVSININDGPHEKGSLTRSPEALI
jgi:hypothetical protein